MVGALQKHEQTDQKLPPAELKQEVTKPVTPVLKPPPTPVMAEDPIAKPVTPIASKPETPMNVEKVPQQPSKPQTAQNAARKEVESVKDTVSTTKPEKQQSLIGQERPSIQTEQTDPAKTTILAKGSDLISEVDSAKQTI